MKNKWFRDVPMSELVAISLSAVILIGMLLGKTIQTWMVEYELRAKAAAGSASRALSWDVLADENFKRITRAHGIDPDSMKPSSDISALRSAKQQEEFARSSSAIEAELIRMGRENLGYVVVPVPTPSTPSGGASSAPALPSPPAPPPVPPLPTPALAVAMPATVSEEAVLAVKDHWTITKVPVALKELVWIGPFPSEGDSKRLVVCIDGGQPVVVQPYLWPNGKFGARIHRMSGDHATQYLWVRVSDGDPLTIKLNKNRPY